MALVVAAGFAAAVLLSRTSARRSGQAPGPKLSRIIVHARARDGSRLVGARCRLGHNFADGRPIPEGMASWAPAPPGATISGGDSEWVIRNVPPGIWEVSVTCPHFAETYGLGYEQVIVPPRGDATVTFELVRGGTVTGRVMDGDTGTPLAGIQVGPAPVSATTDRRGRYVLEHVPPGKFMVQARSERHYPALVACPWVLDKKTFRAPDIIMHAGGWVAGRLELPQYPGHEVHETYRPTVTVHTEGGAGGRPVKGKVQRYWGISQPVAKDCTFRIGPLPPDPYTVEASVALVIDPRVSSHTQHVAYSAERHKVAVRAGEVTEVELVLQRRTHSG
jgi:hypothetical protein